MINILIFCRNLHKYIYLGSNNVEVGGKRYEIEDSLMHEKYNGITDVDNDVGLIKVASDIEFNDYVQPVKVNKEPLKGGEELRALGWGQVQSQVEDYPLNLQELHVKALTNEECKKISPVAPSTQVCTLLAKDYGICSVI